MNTTTISHRNDGEARQARSTAIGNTLYGRGVPGLVWSAAVARTSRRHSRPVT